MKRWKLMGTERLYHSKYMSLFDDRVRLPNGQEVQYTRVELKDFVSILPIMGDRVVMIRTYRYPINRLSLEVPSGYVEVGEDPGECALRELEEETGYKAERLRDMGWFYPWTRSTRRAYLFLAEGLTKGTWKPDETEQIEVKLFTFNEVRRDLRTNKITHAPTIIALQKFLSMQNLMSGTGEVR